MSLSVAIEKFNSTSKTISNGGCVIWGGVVSSSGYGVVYPSKAECYLAHRLSYIINKGPILNKSVIMHSCDVKLCVNPYHLFQGSQKENIHDCYKKGRGKNPKVFSDAELIAIIKDIRPNYIVADEIKVSHMTISRIRSGSHWQVKNMKATLASLRQK